MTTANTTRQSVSVWGHIRNFSQLCNQVDCPYCTLFCFDFSALVHLAYTRACAAERAKGEETQSGVGSGVRGFGGGGDERDKKMRAKETDNIVFVATGGKEERNKDTPDREGERRALKTVALQRRGRLHRVWWWRWWFGWWTAGEKEKKGDKMRSTIVEGRQSARYLQSQHWECSELV